jgi:cellulose biosynthesis protein BcsQ
MSSNPGKIVTFYSFKGGVGRTMALANTAFFAATNGLRTLVMDWDLEAPGVAYYFRGLMDPQYGRLLKDSPGLLNIFCEWSSATRSTSEEELQATVDSFNDGKPYRDCAMSLLPYSVLQDGGSLDYISAGSRTISWGDDIVSYEEALTKFSWSDFFEKQAGGLVISSLRRWCQENYDLVLIDSRTGLADVAGICTMQLPDQVILCFILNRQNIDGISRIARSIREGRDEQVALRAIPMRTAREGTSEESDAKARAIAELTRVGGFSPEPLADDFKRAVRATEGVPFYETLAPLLPQQPAIEVFTANYRQLASEIVGRPLIVPELDAEWLESVQRRLQPKHATVAYLKELQRAEPARAVDELHRLLDAAFEDELDGRVNEEYISALIEAAFHFLEESNANFTEGGFGVAEQAIDLLRLLHIERGQEWTLQLLSRLETFFALTMNALAPDQQFAILEEIDILLLESDILASKLKRIEYKCIAARLIQSGSMEDALHPAISEAWSLIRSVKDGYDLAPDQVETLAQSEAELLRIEAEDRHENGDTKGAIQKLEAATRAMGRIALDSDRTDAARARFSVATRLSQLHMELEQISEAMDWAGRALSVGGVTKNLVGVAFPVLARPFAESRDPVRALAFCEQVFQADPQRVPLVIGSTAGRMPRLTLGMLTLFNSLRELIGFLDASTIPQIEDAMALSTKQALAQLARRRGIVSHIQLNEIVRAVNSFRTKLKSRQAEDHESWDALFEALRRHPASSAGRRTS